MKIFLFILLVILLIVLALILYLLISPLRILVDSEKREVYLGWNHWLNAHLDSENGRWGVRLKLPFWNKVYFIDDLINKMGSRSKVDKATAKSDHQKSKWSVTKVKRILRQIRIREFRWNLDTDNYIWNAYLTPIFTFMNYKTGYPTQINFMGKNEIKINAESRIFNLLVAGIW